MRTIVKGYFRVRKKPEIVEISGFLAGGDGGRIPLSRTPSAPLCHKESSHALRGSLLVTNSRASLLDCGFPGVHLSLHPDTNPLCCLGRGFDLDHIPPMKMDPFGSFSLVEMVCFPNSLFPLILLCFRPVSS